MSNENYFTGGFPKAMLSLPLKHDEALAQIKALGFLMSFLLSARNFWNALDSGDLITNCKVLAKIIVYFYLG